VLHGKHEQWGLEPCGASEEWSLKRMKLDTPVYPTQPQRKKIKMWMFHCADCREMGGKLTTNFHHPSCLRPILTEINGQVYNTIKPYPSHWERARDGEKANNKFSPSLLPVSNTDRNWPTSIQHNQTISFTLLFFRMKRRAYPKYSHALCCRIKLAFLFDLICVWISF